jgi:hypothetical protein
MKRRRKRKKIGKRAEIGGAILHGNARAEIV